MGRRDGSISAQPAPRRRKVARQSAKAGKEGSRVNSSEGSVGHGPLSLAASGGTRLARFPRLLVGFRAETEEGETARRPRRAARTDCLPGCGVRPGVQRCFRARLARDTLSSRLRCHRQNRFGSRRGWCRICHLGENWNGTVTLKEGHELIRSGPYRFIRHPIYTGMLIAFAGTVLALGELSGLLAFV